MTTLPPGTYREFRNTIHGLCRLTNIAAITTDDTIQDSAEYRRYRIGGTSRIVESVHVRAVGLFQRTADANANLLAHKNGWLKCTHTKNPLFDRSSSLPGKRDG